MAEKPAGLLSVPGKGPEKADCVVARVQAQLGGHVYAVHRLDMATSGLMLLAREKAALGKLGQQFERRRIKKAYRAIVAGHLADDIGTVDLPLKTDWPNRPRQMVAEDGRASQTQWLVLARAYVGETPVTHVLLRPITGRSHQLRVHMKEIGHPILGDQLYAPDAIRTLAPRLYLHAGNLGFWHPIKGIWVERHSSQSF